MSEEITKTAEPGQALQAAALAHEIRDIIHHEWAVDIFSNGWLLDAGVPRPSVEAMCFFTGRFLRGKGIRQEVGEAGEFTADHVQKAIDLMKWEDERGLADDIIETNAANFEALRYLYSGSRSNAAENYKHEWWEVLGAFLVPSPDEDPIVQIGERIIARKCLEALILRAVMTYDFKRVHALADALKLWRQASLPNINHAQHIAGLVRREFPPLRKRLGRPPYKSEIREFLLGVSGGLLPDDGNAWAEAFKMMGWPRDGDRKGRMDSDKISQLVNEVIEERRSK